MNKYEFSRWLRDETGSVLPITALAIIFLGGVAALAIDASHLFVLDNKLQASADAAALAASSKLGGDPQEARDTAMEITAKNLPTAIHGAALAEEDVELGVWDPDTHEFTAEINPPNAVRVTIRRTEEAGNAAPTFFAHIMGITSADIVVEAIAAKSIPSCVVALAPSGTGLYVNSASSVLANGCSVRVDSTSSTAINANSGSTVTAEEICVEGDYSGSGFSPTPEIGCDEVGDPLAHLMPPSNANDPCDYTDRVVNSGVETLYPGVYCGKLEVNGGTAYFDPGIYILKDAEFIVNGGGSAFGTGVAFYLTGSSATLKFNAGSHVELTAPTVGELAGIIVFEDRSNPIDNEHLINSDTTSTFEGTVYLSRGKLTINSNATSNGTSPFTAFVAYRFEINSSSGIEINSDYEDSDVPVPKELGAGLTLRM